MKNAMFIMAAVLAASCTTTKYVTVERVRVDSAMQRSVVTDTLVVRDSVYVERGGDTVRTERWRTVWKSRVVVDTVVVCKVDSVQVPHQVTAYVEKKLTWWQRVKMNLGVMFIGVVLMAIAAAAVWMWWNWRSSR